MSVNIREGNQMAKPTKRQRRNFNKGESLKQARKSNSAIDKLTRLIVSRWKSKPIEDVGQHCFCAKCNQDYCIGFDGSDCFCRTCHYVQFNPNACLKRDTTILKECRRCRNAKSSLLPGLRKEIWA